ncbi:MAG: DinB family protein, partial [Chloroflexota bacterium]
MRADEIRLLLAYNEWANDRILDAVEKAGENVYRALAAVSYGSLQGTLVHELAVEWLWRQRCQAGVSPTAGLATAEFPTLAKLRERWREEA